MMDSLPPSHRNLTRLTELADDLLRPGWPCPAKTVCTVRVVIRTLRMIADTRRRHDGEAGRTWAAQAEALCRRLEARIRR